MLTRIMVIVSPVLAATAVILTLGVGSQTASEFVIYVSEREQQEQLESREEILLRFYADRMAALLPIATEEAMHSIVDLLATTLDREIVVARNRGLFYPSADLRSSIGTYSVSPLGTLQAHIENPDTGRTADLEITPILTVTVTPFTPDASSPQDVARLYQFPELFGGLTAEQQRFVSRSGRVIAGYSFGAVVVLGILLGLLLRHNLAPLAALTRATRAADLTNTSADIPTRGPREIRELTTAFTEMTDRLHAVEESRRQMLSDLSHEIRGPLNNLRSELEALQDGLIAPSPTAIDSLHEEVLLLSRLVDDLNELALADSKALPLLRQTIAVDELLQGCARRYALALRSRSVSIALSVSDALPAVTGDDQRLTQAIGNLITNAARYAPAGSQVALGAFARDANVCITVSDNGPGVEPEQMHRIFERFYRTDSSRTRETGGTGLGLAISRAIVEAHGGTIRALPNTPRGLTVELCIPAQFDN